MDRKHRIRHAISRVKMLLLAVILALPLSSCGGGQQQNPQTYACGTPSSGHCYGVVDSGGGCEGSHPIHDCIFGYRTSIYTTQLMTPGDIFIDDEMWLNGFNCYCWVETGYISAVFPPQMTYFWAQEGADGLFIKHYLGPIPTGDFGEYGTYTIQAATSDTFDVSIKNKNTNYQITTTNLMWSSSDGVSRSDHGYVQLGQELAGTGGASANYVLFLYNAWYGMDHNWHYETVLGVPTSDNPPIAGWLVEPATPSPNNTNPGGAFVTHCCA